MVIEFWRKCGYFYVFFLEFIFYIKYTRFIKRNSKIISIIFFRFIEAEKFLFFFKQIVWIKCLDNRDFVGKILNI